MVVEEGRQPEDEFFSLYLIGRCLRSRDGLAAAPLFLLFFAGCSHSPILSLSELDSLVWVRCKVRIYFFI